MLKKYFLLMGCLAAFLHAEATRRYVREGYQSDGNRWAAASGDLQPVSYPFGKINNSRKIKNMSTGDQVTFNGSTSGLRKAELKHLCIWWEVRIDGEDYCFSNLFEITHPKPWYLNTDVCKKGDSGAWIINTVGNVNSWDGMLIAGDGSFGYCCFTEHILEYTNQFFPNGLSLI